MPMQLNCGSSHFFACRILAIWQTVYVAHEFIELAYFTVLLPLLVATRKIGNLAKRQRRHKN